MPEGALRYMDRRDIYGNIYNLFQWGRYITWSDFPRRRPFIDERGFLDAGLLEKTIKLRKKSSVVKELEERYHFQAILITYPILITDTPEAFSEIDIAFHNLDWALVYWDDNSLLYLRRYMDIFKRKGMEKELEKITKLYEKASIESVGEEHFKEGLKAYMSGNYELALREFKKSIEINPSNPVSYSNIGYIYYDIRDLTRAYDTLILLKGLPFLNPQLSCPRTQDRHHPQR